MIVRHRVNDNKTKKDNTVIGALTVRSARYVLPSRGSTDTIAKSSKGSSEMKACIIH